jgi:hypothetical protein
VSLLIIILAISGAVLVYSAVKGKDPREVVKEALSRR